MIKKIEKLPVIVKMFALVLFSAILGLFLLIVAYTIPTDRIVNNAEASMDLYTTNLISEWAGGTRYSHLSNTMDAGRVNESICRAFDSTLENALRCPHYYVNSETNSIENLQGGLSNPDTTQVGDYNRYWHGYLILFIPLLYLTHAGGIRMISMFVQFILMISVLFELGKRNKVLMYLYTTVFLFINPITTILSFQDANIFISGLIFTWIVLKFNDNLKKNNRYELLFTLSGIGVAYFDYLTYPLVAWALPLVTYLIINEEKPIDALKKVVIYSLCWIFGYGLMWVSKWVIGTLLTDINVFVEAKDALLLRTVNEGSDKISYLQCLQKMWESVSDIPMLLLYAVAIAINVVFICFNRKELKFNKLSIAKLLPLLLVGFAPFVWYFVVRNHSFIHPWMEYRELAVLFLVVNMLPYKYIKSLNNKSHLH